MKRNSIQMILSVWLVSLSIFLMVPFNSLFAKVNQINFVEEANWPPFTLNKSGVTTSGLSYDLMQNIFSKLDLKVELELFPQKRMISMIQDGSRDAVTVISKNSKRLKFIDYTAPIFQKKGLIFYLADRPTPIRWNHYKDLKGLKIGITSGHNYGDEFEKAVKTYQLDTEKVPRIEQNFKKLLKKRIDAVLCIELTAKVFLKKPEFKGKIVPADKPYYSKDYYIGFSKKSSAKKLIPQVNKIIQQMKHDGSLAKIISKHID